MRSTFRLPKPFETLPKLTDGNDGDIDGIGNDSEMLSEDVVEEVFQHVDPRFTDML